jgi:ribosomal protein S27E
VYTPVLLSDEVFPQWAKPGVKYERHRPEASLLYQLVEQHWPKFQAEMGRQSKHLLKFFTQEFEEYLQCGRLEHGFLRVRCESCHDEKLLAFSCQRRGFCPSCGARRMADSAAHLVDEVLPNKPIRQWVLSVPFPLRFLFAAQPSVMSKVLGIVYRVISTFLIKRAGFTVKSGAQTGSVTLIQRFGSALNLNLHYHMLYLDGVYDKQGIFYPVKSPTYQDIENIAQMIAERVSGYLEKSGYLIRDLDTEYLDLNTENEAIQSIIGASVTYRLAFGPNAGKKALTLKTLPSTVEAGHHDEKVSKHAGFSLHAGVACKAGQGKKRERLCRYITRPAIAERGGRLRIITGE